MELGAGSGLVGLALALALKGGGIDRNEIFLTDGLDALLPLMAENIALNLPNVQPSTTVTPVSLSWGEKIDPMIPKPPDILLAADCCYLEETFPLLLGTMEQLIGEKTVCYFCYKRRRRADKDMMKMIRKRLKVEEIEGAWQRERVFLYEISR